MRWEFNDKLKICVIDDVIKNTKYGKLLGVKIDDKLNKFLYSQLFFLDRFLFVK